VSEKSVELRFVWFLEQLITLFSHSPGEKERYLLDTLVEPIHIPVSVMSCVRTNWHYSQVDQYVQAAARQGGGKNFWADVPSEFFHGVMASAPLPLLRNVFVHTSRILCPGGLAACRLTLEEDGNDIPIERSALDGLASEYGLVIEHLSQGSAPLGADPAWYDNADNGFFLIARKGSGTADASGVSFSDADFVPQERQPWATPPLKGDAAVPSGIVGRIHYLADICKAKSLLEINIHSPKTFSQLTLPVRVRVSRFDGAPPLRSDGDGTLEIGMSGREFFQALDAGNDAELHKRLRALLPTLQFDLIYINAGPVWPDILDIFTQSIAVAHNKTLFIVNAVVPAHPYGALPDAARAAVYAKAAGLKNRYHYGDAYKAIFAVHDLCQRYSFCTLPGASNQTIIWFSGGTREPFFPSPAAIPRLDYFAMLEHAALLMPVEPEMLPRLIGMHLRPADYAGSTAWKKLIIPLVTQE